MSQNYIIFIVLFSILGFCSTGNINPLTDIEKILSKLNLEEKTDNRDVQHKHNINPLYSHNYAHGHRSKQKRDSPNLMNIQTMNLFLKPRKAKKALDHYLRTEDGETDRMCEITGRCGCTGMRCGDSSNRNDAVADEIDEIIDVVSRQLNKKSDDQSNDDSDSEERRSRQTSDNDRDDDTYGKETENWLRCEGNKCDDELNINDLLRNVEDIDIVVLDPQKLDANENKVAEDIVTYNLINDIYDSTTAKAQRDSNNIKNNKKAKGTDVNLNFPTPEDFVSHYDTVKTEVIKQLLDYVQNNTPIPLKHLKESQKKLLRTLKMKYKEYSLSEKELTDEIVRIVFGTESGTKIYPHSEDNDNIYIPKWHYNSLLQFKKDVLRIKKRLLPLTNKQKHRLNHKINPKIIPKLIWRRNLDQNLRKFGVPFNLEVQGLGQLNA